MNAEHWSNMTGICSDVLIGEVVHFHERSGCTFGERDKIDRKGTCGEEEEEHPLFVVNKILNLKGGRKYHQEQVNSK